jgi:hypothetical protein
VERAGTGAGTGSGFDPVSGRDGQTHQRRIPLGRLDAAGQYHDAGAGHLTGGIVTAPDRFDGECAVAVATAPERSDGDCTAAAAVTAPGCVARGRSGEKEACARADVGCHARSGAGSSACADASSNARGRQRLTLAKTIHRYLLIRA